MRRDPETWKPIRSIHRKLKPDCTSDDESDVEDFRGMQITTLSRLTLPWLAAPLVTFKHAIDSYERKFDDVHQVARKRGNTRTPHTGRVKGESDRPAPQRLPINFYNAEWLDGLDELNRLDLEEAASRVVPVVVRSTFSHYTTDESE